MINFMFTTTLSIKIIFNTFKQSTFIQLIEIFSNKYFLVSNLIDCNLYLDLDEEECRLEPRPERLDLDLDLEDELLLEDRERFLRPFDRVLPRPLLDADDLEL